MCALMLPVIPRIVRVTYGIAILVSFVAGMIASSIIFHYVKRNSNTAALISGVAASAAIGAVIGAVMGAGAPVEIAFGAIGGVIGAVIGIFH
ncbi:Uncharacterised protein [uncultured archaeon]|nr:Uncharacterised protein [uncultured archaeon]